MMLPNISEFIKKHVTKREKSFFDNDLMVLSNLLIYEIMQISLIKASNSQCLQN